MAHSEADRPLQYALPSELQEAYTRAASWLTHNTRLKLDDAIIYGVMDRLLVVEDLGPYYVYTIGNKALRHVVPRAAEVLQAETVELTFCPPHYEQDADGRCELQNPNCAWFVGKVAASPLKSEELSISPLWRSGEVVWNTDRAPEVRDTRPIQKGGSWVERLADEVTFTAVTGLDRITQEECDAMVRIADNLDEVHALQATDQ
jgi:hypothetical protein